ncbi:L,D-transpeptidase family protein [Methylovulum psychrotolerans]|uniref:L,D-transpeptidase family protein n=1 Tax=Methylovulum psychrotolerans TaxID=1704499 RepID=UPI001BFF5153|nr:L,D-transpeptidase family protein [Methylovulum psychrotolerans]MBT9099570.1 L,D-transpeptidase family protein [Methylovulum psychrotolerans]
MSNTQKSLLPSTLGLAVIFAAIVLSGCQSLGVSPDPKTITQVAPEITQISIPTHEFALTDGQTLIGTLATVNTRENDTLSDIARHFGLGYNDITLANPNIPAWTPATDSRVLLPLSFILPDSPHQGITLNLVNMRMFYYPKSQPDKVYTYPIGIGRQSWNTPTGLTRIATKKANPSWYVPASIQKEHAQKGDSLPTVIGPGPDNPLGLYAMNLGFERYLIHGTNKPYGIGMQVSHGCVQLYPEDIEALFNNIAVGTPVRIVHQPYLTAWHNNMLYLEANEPLAKWAHDKSHQKKQLLKQLRQLSAEKNSAVDWEKVERIIARADGIPTPVSLSSPNEAELAKAAVPIKHPDQLNQQPVVAELTDGDWSAVVSRFDNGTEAQKLAAMLNHQGPMIPARKVQQDHSYLVVAGPFKNKQEVNAAAKRIHMDFAIDIKPLQPNSSLSKKL